MSDGTEPVRVEISVVDPGSRLSADEIEYLKKRISCAIRLAFPRTIEGLRGDCPVVEYPQAE